MSDNKDQETVRITPSTDFSDMDATIRLDISGDQESASTPSSGKNSMADLDKTIDGLLDIEELEELLDSEKESDNSEEETLSLSPDEINFDELNAGIDALSQDLQESETEITFGADQTTPFASDDSEGDSLLLSSDNLLNGPLPDEPSSMEKESEKTATPGTNTWTNLSGKVEFDENHEVEEEPPVIKLTKEMLNEPEQSLLPEPDDSQKNDDKSLKDNGLEGSIETPELTTTETHILADATSAIKKITKEEKTPEEVAASVMSTQAIEQSESPGRLPSILGMSGIIAGGFGAWMAWSSLEKVETLENQLKSAISMVETKHARDSAEREQRLSKIEQRLTGTPAIEAAAPLSPTTSKPEKTAPKTKTVVKAITPQTGVVDMQSKAGDWVVNLSSHKQEPLAREEEARLKKIGLSAEVHAAQVKDRTWYRVQITGFATKDEAKSQLRSIQKKSGITDAWIGKK